MSKQTARLAAYFKNNKLALGSAVVGIVAVIAIAGVLAWSNDSGNPEQPKQTAQTQTEDQNKDEAQKPEEKNGQETAANTGNTGDTAVLGESTSTGDDDTATVETAATAPKQVTDEEDTPAQPAGNQGDDSGDNDGDTPGTDQPGQGGGDTGNGDDGSDDGDDTPTDPGTPVDPAKFDKARVSLTFDDGWQSIHDNALPLLNQYGLVSTQYVNGEPTIKSDPASPAYDYWTGYMDSQGIKDFASAGHEIAWHTNTHTDLVGLGAAARDAELQPSTDFINLLMNVNVNLSDNYAAPYGTRDAATVAAAKAAGFNSYRTTDDGYNTKGATDPMNLKVKNICGIAVAGVCAAATTPADVAGWIADAQAANAWLIIVFHEVAGINPDPNADCEANLAMVLACGSDYAVTPANLQAELELIKDSGIAVQTVDQALDELAPQL